ncbi:MAG: hypothetical protein AAFQ89_22015 [Cyanobacteria bacterium J06626_18]
MSVGSLETDVPISQCSQEGLQRGVNCGSVPEVYSFDATIGKESVSRISCSPEPTGGLRDVEGMITDVSNQNAIGRKLGLNGCDRNWLSFGSEAVATAG